MSKLENAIFSLHKLSQPAYAKFSAVAWLITVIAYIVAVLSVPLFQPQRLVWFAIFPVVMAEMSGIGFGRVFVKSLWILPFVALIAIFNPFFDSRTAFIISGIEISQGWVSCFSIILRGLLSVQALIIMIQCVGFYNFCRALHRLACPKILVTQIQFTYRYMIVIAEEALNMDRARKARGFGKKNYPLKMWGKLAGQLLIRSYERATRIHKAMLSRGFIGTIQPPSTPTIPKKTTITPTIITTNTKTTSATTTITTITAPSILFSTIWLITIALIRFLPLPF